LLRGGRREKEGLFFLTKKKSIISGEKDKRKTSFQE